MTDGPRRTKAATTIVAALTVAWTLPVPALAHEVDPDVRFVIEAIDPQVPGVVIEVVRSVAPQVLVRNDTAEVLEALDPTGRPFLRIGPDGVVADVASRAWLDTADPAGLPPGVTVPGDLDPVWQSIRAEPAWGWFDHRLHPQVLTFAGPALEDEVLDRWQLDFRLGGEPLTVVGRTERRPKRGDVVAGLDRDDDPLTGVQVRLLPGAVAGLFVTATRPVTVLGADDEPFLRFDADGVHANRRSPTWARSGRATQGTVDPRHLDVEVGAEPDWVRVSTGTSYGWIDPRTAAPETLPAGVDASGPAPVVVATWRIRFVGDDGRTADVTGTTRFVPARAIEAAPGRPWPWVAAAVGITLLGVGAWRRRRSEPPGSA